MSNEQNEKKEILLKVNLETGEAFCNWFAEYPKKRQEEYNKLFNLLYKSMAADSKRIMTYALVAEFMLSFVALIAFKNDVIYNLLSKFTRAIRELKTDQILKQNER